MKKKLIHLTSTDNFIFFLQKPKNHENKNKLLNFSYDKAQKLLGCCLLSWINFFITFSVLTLNFKELFNASAQTMYCLTKTFLRNPNSKMFPKNLENSDSEINISYMWKKIKLFSYICTSLFTADFVVLKIVYVYFSSPQHLSEPNDKKESFRKKIKQIHYTFVIKRSYDLKQNRCF